MKGMDCKRAAGLLPLYAAGDLDAARAGEVASHLIACAGCRRLAGEFSESRALLGEAFETPDFGAEFYSGIRSSVLERIARDREPSTPSFVAALFGRRLAYATTFAVALVALALAFQHFRGGARQTPPLAGGRQTVDAPQQERRGESRTTTPDAGKNEPTPKPTYAAANQRGESTRRAATDRRRRGLAPKTAAREGEGAQVALVTPPSLDGARGAGESASPAGGASSSSRTAAAPEVSRIEIQTADPSIRIIWLAPRQAEAPEPNEPKNEHGERK